MQRDWLGGSEHWREGERSDMSKKEVGSARLL